MVVDKLMVADGCAFQLSSIPEPSSSHRTAPHRALPDGPPRDASLGRRLRAAHRLRLPARPRSRDPALQVRGESGAAPTVPRTDTPAAGTNTRFNHDPRKHSPVDAARAVPGSADTPDIPILRQRQQLCRRPRTHRTHNQQHARAPRRLPGLR